MSETELSSTSSTASGEADAPKPADERTIMGLPATVFVKGGGATTSWREDMRIKQEEADAERRRDQQDAERRVAAIPVEQGGAKMFTRSEADPQGTPKVLLRYMTMRGDPHYEFGHPVECLADIIVPPDSSDLVLTIVCPQCKERGIPQGQCQLKIQQSNRAWHLDTRKAGELFVFDGQPYYSAGVVMDSERFTCPKCSWSARIHENKIRPE